MAEKISLAILKLRINRLWTITALCLAIATIFRIARFPDGHSPAQPDEVAYLSDGLLLLDGETSINKYAPSGPLTWFSAVYAGIRTIGTLFDNGSDTAIFPTILRPVAALESTLFDLYADMSTMRLIAVIAITALTLTAIVAACKLGKSMCGISGELLAGLMAAALPMFVELSTETRPYAIAWAFALLSLATAVTDKAGTRTVATGILLGLAIGSHIDMGRIIPLIFFLQWRNAQTHLPWRGFGKTAAVTVATFLIVAPWYPLHIIDNIRQILSTRLMHPANEGISIWVIWFKAGIIVPMAVATAGLLLAATRRDWPVFGCGIWLLLNIGLALHPSAHGLQHDGALLVMLVVLAPLGLSILIEAFPIFRKPLAVAVAVAIIVGPTVWWGALVSFGAGRSLKDDQAVAWIESNIPQGTSVYIESDEFQSLLPTPEAADRLWADVASPAAWIAKYRHDVEKYDLSGGRPLRVMSADRLASDLGNRRRFYILGAPLHAERPRYDLWTVSEGSFFDVTQPAVIEKLCRDGGVYLHNGAPIMQLPQAAMSWVRADGNSTYIYRMPANGCMTERMKAS